MTEYPHICITDPHSTIFELFDPTRIWLFQYSHGICHWKIEIYTMYSHIYLQFDNFWAYSTRPAFDQMIFALNRTRLFHYLYGICHWKIEIYTTYSQIYSQFDHLETNRPDPHLTKWYLHWTVFDYFGIRSFTTLNIVYIIWDCIIAFSIHRILVEF